MDVLAWIVLGGLAMSAIALVGAVTLVLPRETLERLELPLVAFAAGSLLGGAMLHLLPAAQLALGPGVPVFVWVLVGFTSFFALEQLLHWHHCTRAASDCRTPLTWLILIGDGLHNLLGGMAVAGAFLVDVQVGLAAWVAAAAHEVPQELGDFGVLIHGGWSRRRALAFNLLSGLTFFVGGLLAWALARQVDVTFLLPFAAGNFLYIGATDLVPEVNKHQGPLMNAVLLGSFVVGVALLWAVRSAFVG